MRCNNTVLSETNSPGAELKAVVFTRSCGATTGVSTHVSILPETANLRPKDGGNLFIADTDHLRGPKVGLRFRSSGTAAITCDCSTISELASSRLSR
jgi:hypothetical protein